MRVDRDDGTVLAPYGTWCPLVEIGVGCGDYHNRPKACRTFQCIWLESQKTAQPLPEEWRPDKSKVVLVAGKSGMSLIAHVDPDRPDAYHRGALGRWLANLGEKMVVTAKIGDRGVAIGTKAAGVLADKGFFDAGKRD